MCNIHRYSQFFILILCNIEFIWIKIKFIIQIYFQIYNKLINYYFNYHLNKEIVNKIKNIFIIFESLKH